MASTRNSVPGRLVALSVILVLFAAGLIFSLTAGYFQDRELCASQKRSWDIDRAQIEDDAKPQPANEAILRTIPAFRAYGTPGTPEYEQARVLAEQKRTRKLALLGNRPSC